MYEGLKTLVYKIYRYLGETNLYLVSIFLIVFIKMCSVA